MQKFSDTIATTKPDGTIEVLPSATVTVYLAGTTTPATIYSTNTGTAKTNPFLSAASTGRIEFYAADGRYDLRVDKAGYATVSVLDVLLEDPDNIDDNLDGVTISNSTLSSCILLNATVNDVDSVSFSDTPDALTPRRMAWNADEGTLDVALDNSTTLQLGQELHYRAHNATAATIADGAVVWATGTTGASGRISVGLAVADGSQPGKTVMGLMTHATAAGSDGYVAAFGKVRGVNTTGSAVGETWVNGDILYLHPTIPGALTKVKPTVNGHIVVTVAIVIYAGNNGTLFARPMADSQEADEIRYTPAGTGAVATTVQKKLREFVSVKDFGAVGDGAANDTTAVQAAVTHCFTTGDQLYWSDGTYLTTASISNFHEVKHIGAGVVKRGSALWYIEPQDGQINILNVASSGGSDSNDGLGPGESFEHAQRAVNILETIGPKAAVGRWKIQYGAGTFNESVVSTDIPFFTNYLEFRGQRATVPTWAPGQTVAVGDFRMCQSTMLFMAESEGVTGATEPKNPFGTSFDGGVTWRWIGGHRAWASGQVVSAGEFRTSATKVYYTIAGGTCGGTAPTHSGTSAVSDGGVLWVFVGHYNAPPTTYPTTIISGALNPALWTTSQVVKAGAARRVGTRCYVAAAAGTCGASTPTHTSGTVSDGGVPWRYIGEQDATLGTNGIWFTPGCRANFLDLQFVNWERTAFGDYAFLFENLGQVLAQFVVARNCSIGPAVINNGSLICQNTIHVNCQNGAWGTYNSKLSLGTSSATSCFVHNCDSGMYVSRSCIAHSDWTTFASNRNGQTISILSRTHSLASNYIQNVKPWWAIGSSEFVNNPTTINGFYWQTSLANTEPGRSDGFSRVDEIHNEECQAEIRYSAFFGSSTFTADAGTAGVSTIVNSANKNLPQDWFLSNTRKLRVVVKGAWTGTDGAKAITASLGATTITGVSSIPNTETGDFVFEAEIVPTGINTQVASYRYTRHSNTVRVLNNSARAISVIDANGKNVTQPLRIYANLAAAGDSLTLYSVEWFITG